MPQQWAAHQFARDLLCGAVVVWRDKFRPVNRIDKEQRAAILKKYGGDARGGAGTHLASRNAGKDGSRLSLHSAGMTLSVLKLSARRRVSYHPVPARFLPCSAATG